MNKLLLVLLWQTFVGCAATIDDANPGLCELKCEGANIAGVEAVFRSAGPQGVNINKEYTCVGNFQGQAAVEMSGPVTLQFILEDAKPNLDGKTGSMGDGAGKKTPLGGVIFEPLILGGAMQGTRTNTENATIGDDGAVDPYKYSGIVTPKSEWCTDSCGVATIEIWPLCVNGEDNKISIQIHSGAAYSEISDINVKGVDTGAAALKVNGETKPLENTAIIIDEKDIVDILDK